MCGVAGTYNYRTGAPVVTAQLEQMSEQLRRRGPDGDGIYVDGKLGLAHRRLSIIDLEGGAQPMPSHDKQVWISYNGEVYNYVELRRELTGYGHRFSSDSDTETVLAAYQHWGLDFASHLNGMFALAIWDAAKERLVLCRDRMGIKPMYFAQTRDGVVFASEMKALRGVDGIDQEIELEALDEYMTCGYVMCPRTLIKGIRKLPPAHLMVFEPDQEPRQHRYWQLAFRPDYARSEADWHEEIIARFNDSVKLRLRSDVPLGTLLSGGVDSTLIAATMARLRGDPRNIHSFCIGVDIPGAETEFNFARQVADELGLNHHERRLDQTQFCDSLAEAAQLLDEPLAEPMVGQLLSLCQFAREHVTVVLSGEGADETWFGYPSYRLHAAISIIQRHVPRPLLHGMVDAVNWTNTYARLPARVIKNLRLFKEPLERRYLGLNYFDTKTKDRLLRPDVRAALQHYDSRAAMARLYQDDVGGEEPQARMAAVDCRAWLLDNTLLRSDHMSMAASLELRVPFLDHRLVELAAKVPARKKVSATDQKIILKEALADRLPQRVSKRRKMGFPTPLPQLFRGRLGEQALELFRSPSSATKNLIDFGRLVSLTEQHIQGSAKTSKVLFQMMMLERWAREWEQAV